jgi:hypothetical protein
VLVWLKKYGEKKKYHFRAIMSPLTLDSFRDVRMPLNCPSPTFYDVTTIMFMPVVDRRYVMYNNIPCLELKFNNGRTSLIPVYQRVFVSGQFRVLR